MEAFLSQIEWVPTLVAAVLAFMLGWAWYSPAMFLKRWQEGMGTPVWQAPMWMPMSAQFGSTLLFSIIIGAAAADGHIGHAVLVGITIAGFIKAGGFYSGKTMFAVSVETGYIVVMTLLMIGVHLVL